MANNLLLSSAYIFKIVFIAFCYYVTGRLGLLLAVPPGYATAVWPPSGLALAVLLCLGRRYWPGIMLGSFCVNVFISFDVTNQATMFVSASLAVVIATGAVLQAVAGASLVRHFISIPNTLDRARDICLLVILGGPVSCLVNASLSTTTLALSGAASWENYGFHWFTWWIGDSIGVIVFTPILLLLLETGGLVTRNRKIMVSLASCAVFMLAILAFFWASHADHKNQQLTFERHAIDLKERVLDHLGGYVMMLPSIRNFFAASDYVSPEEFHTFVKDNYESDWGIYALSWNQRVTDEERASFENDMRLKKAADFAIRDMNDSGAFVPAPKRSQYMPVTYVEPFALNKEALGYDTYVEPRRKTALDEARQSGAFVATEKTEIVQDNLKKAAFIVYQPVYKNSDAPEAERIQPDNVRGYVAGVFLFSEVFKNTSFLAAKKNIMFTLRDGGVEPGQSLLYDSCSAGKQNCPSKILASHNSLQWQETLAFAGRSWIMQVLPDSDYPALRHNWYTWLVLSGGVLFAGMLGAFLLLVTGQTDSVQKMVHEKTSQLAEYAAAMEKAKKEADQAYNAKSEFLAKMSHEIRTPLNGLLGFIDLARDTHDENNKDSYIGKAQSAGDTLLKIINDILDLAKIESGKIVFDYKNFDIRAVLDICVDMFSRDAYRKNIGLYLNVDAGVPAILVGDEFRIKQILINLIGNAVKFTDHGMVKVDSSYKNGTLLITVLDSGIGIEEKMHQAIFENFTQEDSGTTQRFGGTGLGLAIVKQLLENMGGSIFLESSKGAGSKFHIAIPMAEGVSGDLPSAAIVEAPHNLYKILLVDDTPMNQEVGKIILERAGHFVSVASNGKEAIACISRESFDLVLMDIQMPVMNGMDAVRYIRQDMGLSQQKLKIIALTAHVLPDDRKKFLDGGMNSILIKPFKAKELLAEVQKAISHDQQAVRVLDSSAILSVDKSPLFQPQRLEDLREVLGAQATAAIIRQFSQALSENLSVLKEPRQYPDDIVQGTLHTLSSNAGTVGLERLSSLCRTLLDRIDDVSYSELLSSVYFLECSYKEGLDLLEKYVDERLS